jgi:hypothetical protein
MQEEIMKHMEEMLGKFQSDDNNKIKQENDLKECIGYLEANHGPMSKNRKNLISKNFKVLIDKLLPDFVK